MTPSGQSEQARLDPQSARAMEPPVTSEDGRQRPSSAAARTCVSPLQAEVWKQPGRLSALGPAGRQRPPRLCQGSRHS